MTMKNGNPPTRALLGALLVLLFSGREQLLADTPESGAVPSSEHEFSAQWLTGQARSLAGEPFRVESLPADHPVRDLDYDAYRRIRFDPRAAIPVGDGQPFELQLFHPGFLHNTPVDLFLVEDGRARALPFSTERFLYHESLGNPEALDPGGHAGFRVHYPINTAERIEEFLVFLGASYFRAVGRDQFYGLSARGLAVNTVGPGTEEFPRFSDFWIEHAEPGSDSIRIHALLDSQSVTGAYRFDVTPGETTRIDVDARLFPRRDLPHAGIAPLTSMFLFDATSSARFDDFRPAVHDSDGLSILQRNGERVWRPLANPRALQVSSFTDDTPAGFGLMQRSRDFDDFRDDEARYDRRPGLWIEPLGDWGAGRVELVEIPTAEEINDNIVAYWQPAEPLRAGNEYRYRYRMHWGDRQPSTPDAGRVVETAAGTVPRSTERLFVIDFSGGDQLEDPETVRIQAETSAGQITDVSGTVVRATGAYRAYVKLEPGEADLAELRVTLNADGASWGETWLYRWTR